MTDLLKGQNNGKGRVLYEKSIRVWSGARENAKARCAQESSSEGGSSPPPHRYPPKSKGPEYADLGDFQKSWRLVVPPEAIYQGAKSTMIFKTWRIWWALEAVISHRPSGIHGDRMVKSHQVALISYGTPQSMPVPIHLSSILQPDSRLDYNITTSSSTVGASDPFFLNVALCRHAKAEAVKRVSVELRREICYAQDLSDASYARDVDNGANGKRSVPMLGRAHRRSQSSNSVSMSRNGHSQDAYRNSQQGSAGRHMTPPQQIPTPMERDEAHVTSYFDSFEPQIASSRPAGRMDMSSGIPPPVPLPPITFRPGKREDVSLATFEADVNLNNEGVWSGRIGGNMPKAKSLYHYALGESCETSSAYSRFYLVVRIHFRQRGSVLELPHRDITFTTISADERAKAVEQLPRIQAIQNVEVKLVERNAGSDSDSDSRMDDDQVKEESTGTRATTRRRSEQHETQDNMPRRRMRYGSVPDLSPVVSSPTVASPNLSIASSMTQRPRTATSRRVTSHNAPLRGTRPKSSGGLSTSSASLRSTPSIPSFTGGAALSNQDSSPSMPNPFAYGGSPHSSPHLQVPTAEPAGLFANFAGFTLRPPAEGLGNKPTPVKSQEDVPPKPNTVQSRKREKSQADDPVFSYQPPVLLSRSEPTIISVSLTNTSSRSSETDESTRSSPPAMMDVHSHHKQTATATELARSPSKTPSILDPLSSNGQTLLGKRKTSMTLGFNFFRRGSKS